MLERNVELMKLHSDAKTLRALQLDIVSYLEMRAEQNRAMEKVVRSFAAKRVYLHAACEIQSIADDVKYMKVME